MEDSSDFGLGGTDVAVYVLTEFIVESSRTCRKSDREFLIGNGRGVEINGGVTAFSKPIGPPRGGCRPDALSA